jgi:sarcosine oxidase subunit gamma
MNSRLVSPLQPALLEGDPLPHAQFAEVRGMSLPLQLAEPAEEQDFLRSVALADASFLPRVVVKGPNAATFLESQGVTIPTEVRVVGPLEGGGLIARTGSSEFFLEDGPTSNVVERIETALQAGHDKGSGVFGGNSFDSTAESHPAKDSRPPHAPMIDRRGVYRVLRQDASLVIAGLRAGELLRHVCGYDFITDPHDKLVFTQVAGVSCSLLRRELNGIPCLRLWTDGTYGLYIWRTLLEVAAELGGGAVGTALFFPEIREAQAS